MTKKRFDCVEMQHEGGRRIYEALKGKSRDEQIAYWRERNESMRRWIEETKSAKTVLPRS